MKRTPHLVCPALLLAALAAPAADMRICIQDRAGISGPTRAGLAQELRALMPKLDVEWEREGCGGLSGSRVLLVLLQERPGVPEDALGLSYRSRGVILPRLEVFVEPVLDLTRAGDWGTLGRALARVAAHELLHYRLQTGDHRAHGLMQAKLTPAELVSEDIRPRLMASLHQD